MAPLRTQMSYCPRIARVCTHVSVQVFNHRVTAHTSFRPSLTVHSVEASCNTFDGEGLKVESCRFTEAGSKESGSSDDLYRPSADNCCIGTRWLLTHSRSSPSSPPHYFDQNLLQILCSVPPRSRFRDPWSR